MGLGMGHLDTVGLAWSGAFPLGMPEPRCGLEGPRGQFHPLTVPPGTVLPAPPSSRAGSQAWRQPLHDPRSPKEVGGSSSLGKAETSQMETRFPSSLLLERVKPIALACQVQSLSGTILQGTMRRRQGRDRGKMTGGPSETGSLSSLRRAWLKGAGITLNKSGTGQDLWRIRAWQTLEGGMPAG